MTKIKGKSPTSAVQALFSQHPDGLRAVVRTVLQEVLEVGVDQRRSAVHPQGGVACCQFHGHPVEV